MDFDALLKGSPCDGCGGPFFLFMIHDALWLRVAGDAPRKILCASCVEEKLGRLLTGADFTPARINAALRWGMTRSA